MPTRYHLNQILELSGLAPSPENNQPWQVEILNSYMTVSSHPDRGLETDKLNLLNWVSIGAFLENLHLSAVTFGYLPEFHILPKTEPLQIRISFTATTPIESPLFKQIRRRFSDRSDFKKTPLSEELISELVQTAGNEVKISITTDSASIALLAQIHAQLDKVRLTNKVFHREIFISLRYSVREFLEKRDGILFSTLKIPCGRLYLSVMKLWSTISVIKALRLIWTIRLPLQMKYQSCSLYAAFIPLEETVSEYIKCGRAMQRFWLAATAHQLGCHPLGNIPYFCRFKSVSLLDTLTSKDQAAIRQHIEKFWSLNPLEPLNPAMILRVGMGGSPKPIAIRYAKITNTPDEG